MAEVLFFMAGTGAIAGAIGVIAMRNPFYSVLALVGHLLSLAALFLLLRAEFVAAAQVVVYAGAVMVLYVFVVAYIGGDGMELPGPGRGSRLVAQVFAALLLVELSIATLGSAVDGIGGEGAPFDPAFGSPERIGELFLNDFVLAFELASYLLLVAAVGAVTLSRRRRGPGADEIGPRGPAGHRRPLGTGTMAEAVDGRLPPPAGVPDPDPVAGGSRGATDAEGGW